jgi:hypothetical protein
VVTAQEKEYILARAYIPEHIITMMTLISKGEPFFEADHVYYLKDNWAILVGYPLSGNFVERAFEDLFRDLMERFKCEYWWVITPAVLTLLPDRCRERESDQYYRLSMERYAMKGALRRIVQKGAEYLTIERARDMADEHGKLIREFIKRERPPDRIRELFLSMPEYARESVSALVLNARDAKGRLTAFYVVELAAASFADYVAGCYSKKNYVPHASDLLFAEMVEVAREEGKDYINLGLGVNEGIRRFKEKWGGVAFLTYEFAEYYTGHTKIFTLIQSLESKL